MVKKIYILRILTVCCYVALSINYIYAMEPATAAPPYAGQTAIQSFQSAFGIELSTATSMPEKQLKEHQKNSGASSCANRRNFISNWELGIGNYLNSCGAAPQKTNIIPSIDRTTVSISPSSEFDPLLVSICGIIEKGDSYYRQKHYPTAIVYYMEALQKYAHKYTERGLVFALICQNLGVSLLEIKQYQQSYLCLHQALTIRNESLSIASTLNNEEVCKEISKITGQSHYSLGRLYFAVGKVTEAIISFKAAMSTEFSAINTLPEVQMVGDSIGDSVGDNVDDSVGDHVGDSVAHNVGNLVGDNIRDKGHLSNTSLHAPSSKKHLLASTIGVQAFSEDETLPQHKPLSTKKKVLSSTQYEQYCNDQDTLTVPTHGHTKEKKFACSFCDKRFAIKGNMRTHMRTHIGEKPYECAICNRKFSQKQEVKKHLRTHTGEKPFSCAICDKKFSQKENMQVHLRVHTGEKPFKCPMCPKKFAQKTKMQIHMRVHTGEKPFSCTICHKKFAAKEHVKAHVRRMHKN